ncbi:hypothetical protein [Ruegeria arenilitoris]|uniref:hypothetical protein n=1 Tax=Ruegeria arenilitoris TaxID=1173585 RepID=UPI00147EA73E|nr:hypothetical protein [Ruegeria arenilitoris]
MKKTKIAIISAFTASMILAAPAFAVIEEPDPDPEPTTRGDNGWGNGPDSTNAGSFSGGTASSKSTNGTERNDRNYPDALDKFDGR